MAEEQDVDLVEISPTAKPPCSKLMDYGKIQIPTSQEARRSQEKPKAGTNQGN